MSDETTAVEEILPEGESLSAAVDELSTTETTETTPTEESPKTEATETTATDNKAAAGAVNPAEPTPTEEARSSERPEARLNQYVNDTHAAILNTMSGAHSTAYNTYFGVHHAKDRETQPTLEGFITVASLESSNRAYKSLNPDEILSHSGVLLSERILLLSCHDEDIAGNVAKRIAFETRIQFKELVTIDQNGQGSYNFKHFIECLARPKEKRKASTNAPVAICVWEVGGSGDDEISTQILDSLLSDNLRVQQYKSMLSERGLCLICLVSPQRVQDYVDSRSAVIRLRSWKIDFLTPLLEEYEVSDYENLAQTILQQRQERRWSDDDAEFYKEITKCLRDGNLLDRVGSRPLPQRYEVNVEELFEWQDPLIRTVLYCATFFRDLSLKDFSYLVELFLGETTEEVIKRVNRTDSKGPTEVVESVPLVKRWQRDADAILRQCKLASTRNENDRRVVDFKLDGLRKGLNEYIRNEQYYFFESNFVLLRERGLLFSPRKAIVEAARRLFVDMATQYETADVANWLYEVLEQFEEVAEAAEQLKEHALAVALPELKVKAARRYLSHSLSRLLIRLDKEEELREAVRLFWRQLLQTQHQWFLDLLRRMGDSAPPETLKWLKQLLDQSTPDIRRQARRYIVNYLLHRESTVYETLKEMMQWSESTPAREIAQEVLIVYCLETNRQVDQQDYGRWPSPHPLFVFKDRRETKEYLDLLVGWVYSAAFEVDPDKGLFLVADILAGWYFILSPVSQNDSTGTAAELAGETGLNATVVRELLFQALANHSPSAQKSALAAVWEQLKDDMLDQVLFVDALINEIPDSSLSAEVLTNAETARCKLLEARASLGKLREAFLNCTPQVTAA